MQGLCLIGCCHTPQLDRELAATSTSDMAVVCSSQESAGNQPQQGLFEEPGPRISKEAFPECGGGSEGGPQAASSHVEKLATGHICSCSQNAGVRMLMAFHPIVHVMLPQLIYLVAFAAV